MTTRRVGSGPGKQTPPLAALLLAALALPAAWARPTPAAQSLELPVWQKTEIVLRAERPSENPYRDTAVWVDLEGPSFRKRCYGFWDGGDTFRVRVLATRAGRWRWRSGSRPADPGLSGRHGELVAREWSEAERRENPCRRRMIRPGAGGPASEHADGPPLVLPGDPLCAAGPARVPWREGGRARGDGGPGWVLPAPVRFAGSGCAPGRYRHSRPGGLGEPGCCCCGDGRVAREPVRAGRR